MAPAGVAARRLRRDAGDAAPRARRVPRAARPRLPAFAAARLPAARLRPVAPREPRLDRLRAREHCTRLPAACGGLRLARVPLPGRSARLRAPPVAALAGGGGALPRRLPRLRAGARREPRPVAPGLRRREAHGLRLPQRRAAFDHHAAARPVVCGRGPQLLLLRAVHGGDGHQGNRHSVGHRLQPRRAPVLRANGRRGVLGRLQRDRGRAPLAATGGPAAAVERGRRGRRRDGDGRRDRKPARRRAAPPRDGGRF